PRRTTRITATTTEGTITTRPTRSRSTTAATETRTTTAGRATATGPCDWDDHTTQGDYVCTTGYKTGVGPAGAGQCAARCGNRWLRRVRLRIGIGLMWSSRRTGQWCCV